MQQFTEGFWQPVYVAPDETQGAAKDYILGTTIQTYAKACQLQLKLALLRGDENHSSDNIALQTIVAECERLLQDYG